MTECSYEVAASAAPPIHVFLDKNDAFFQTHFSFFFKLEFKLMGVSVSSLGKRSSWVTGKKVAKSQYQKISKTKFREPNVFGIIAISTISCFYGFG